MLKGNKRGPLLVFIRDLIRRFKSKVETTKLFDGAFDKTAIFISNHSGASGPMNLTIYFSEFFRPLGTFEMVGNYRQRWHYLYYTFYQTKLKYSKVKSYILATLFAIISRMLYYDIGLIPTYPDARFISTIKICMKALNNQQSLLVFPEDSSQEYSTEIKKFFAGFVVIARKFYELHQIDIPIYPMYFSKEKQKIVVGDKHYIQPLLAKGMDNEQIADFFRNIVNDCGRLIYQGK